MARTSAAFATLPKPTQAKASLPEAQFRLMPLVRLGLVKACGSLKAAAIDMQIDQGQLTRELDTAKFKFERLELLTAEQQAEVFKAIAEEVTPLTTPMARLREIDRQEQALRDERWQLIEALAS